MQLLRTILIIILVYYLFRFIFRYVIPFLLITFVRRSKRNENHQKKNGEVSIDYIPEKKEYTHEIGEYVDFEEVETNERKNK